MLQKGILTFGLLLIIHGVWAQLGSISGVVSDSKSGESIIGANVVIEGTSIGAASDVDGNFIIQNVKPGTYRLSISFITYKTHIVPDVVVESGKKTSLKVQLQEDATELQEVVVSGTREINTDFALIDAIKASKLVVSGISAEQISKSQDRDAAQVVRRVPGITLGDNRFVIVRGLNSRYSTVILNGVIAPSTETDSRAFSFDIIPSGLLDRMLVYKSGAAELPGEFAGSVIQVSTKSAVEENFAKFSISGGYRANTTFSTFNSQQRSATEWLGFDNGLRQLPENTPSDFKTLGTNGSAIENASRQFRNSWGTEQMTAMPDMRMSFDYGRNFYLGKMDISTINSISYSNTNQANQILFRRYSNYNADREGQLFFDFNDDQFNNNVRLGFLSNWTFRLSDKTKIEFRNMYTRLGTTQTTFRTGADIDKGQDVLNNSFRYSTRGIYTGQLEGKHTLSNTTKVNWLVGVTSGNRSEPDWKRSSARRNRGTEEPFVVFVPSVANPANAARFYQDLKEINATHRLDFEFLLGKKTAGDILLKTGYWLEYKSREFNARQIGYVQRGNISTDVARLPLDQIFAPENIDYLNGYTISENTKNTDSYDATNLLGAGYAGINLPVSEKILLIPGIRVEYNRMQVKTKPGPNAGDVDNPVTSILPFANLTYNLSTSSLIRMAYSRTVSRPEFRELAPFTFYDFDLQLDVIGNTSLKVANVHNVDLRWELYPTPSELVSFGVFYKNFNNPIETRIITGANNPILLFQNAKAANNGGVELEVRKSIAYTSSSRFMNNLSVVFNAAYIFSEIELNDDGTLTEQVSRPMQGQSPYVINAGLFYQDEESGLQVNAQYNVYGKRISFVGDFEFPTIWEMPRHVVDLTASKRIGQRSEFRIGISDLLNTRILFREDANQDNKIDNSTTDKTIRETRNGQYFTIGYALKF
jgi:outer membrane receptor for ferrienterochelin and colicin